MSRADGLCHDGNVVRREYLGTAARHFSMGNHARQRERGTMAAATEDSAGASAPPRRPDVALPEDAPPTFVADPPTDLSAPSSGGFTAKAKSPHGAGADAKSPHGISRTGIVLLDESAPSSGRPVSGRRPVVAVLDTVISAHPWLGDGTGPDPFWRLPGEEATPEPWRRPVLATSDPLDQDAALAAARVRGHGTFIAGIVRQLAPEARILSLPVMNDVGKAETPDVLDALTWLLARVRYARTATRPDLFVDVVNLSFGWYRGEGEKEFPADAHRKVLDDLGAEGVRVVASAGNRSTTVPVYPAAFAGAHPGSPTTGLVSVGALDPNGELAAYSNSGVWVLLLAPGTGLLSTVPRTAGVDWSDPPVDGRGCPYPNPNHQARGFARWGGTSFAAAWVSATIAAHLLDEPQGAGLGELGLDATRARAATALAATEEDIEVWKRQSRVPS